MLKLDFPKLGSGGGRVLCLGAHCDDIEIGCGGTVLELIARYPDLHFKWIALSSDDVREREAAASAQLFLDGATGKSIDIKRFRNAFFPSHAEEIKGYFETLKEFDPDLILTHTRDDRHQDHRVVCELTWNTFRNHLILEYEIPKYDGDLGQPGVYVSVSKEAARQKMGHIFECFRSQSSRHWFTEDLFLGLMRLRGIECAEFYAEAFYCRKAVI